MGHRFIWHWRIGLAVAALGCCGCPSIAVPSLLHPGPAAYQRDVAEIFDPYPAPEVAHSSDQVRPPGFMQPMSEIKRCASAAARGDHQPPETAKI